MSLKDFLIENRNSISVCIAFLILGSVLFFATKDMDILLTAILVAGVFILAIGFNAIIGWLIEYLEEIDTLRNQRFLALSKNKFSEVNENGNKTNNRTTKQNKN